MSPDAFCQAAIQLAYYRLRGEVALTYESGGTVRFFYGRTETVRSLSTARATLIVLATYLLLIAAVVATAQVVPIRF